MVIHLKNKSSGLDKEKIEVIKKFLQFLQGEMSLKEDIIITFVGSRDVKMTTGVRKPGNKIYALACHTYHGAGHCCLIRPNLKAPYFVIHNKYEQNTVFYALQFFTPFVVCAF